MKQILAVAICLTAVLVNTRATAWAQVESPPDTGRISPIQCPIEVPDSVTVTCGALYVPENHTDPNSAEIRLPYIVLHSKNANPAPDPVIFTAGGPGLSSLASVWGLADSPMLADRDVIVFEQRGNRYAEPSLVCDGPPLWEEVPGNTPCLDSISSKGVDISQYNTPNIVHDIIALRQALGYEQWNLLGGSFSSSLMLLVLEADPDGVRSAILHSVKLPNETSFDHEADAALRSIRQLFADCAADSLCAAAYPNLEAQFHTLVQELNESPVQVEVRSSSYEELVPVEIDGDTFIDWIMLDSFYRPAYPPFSTAYLPLLIQEMSRGNFAPLAIAAQSYRDGTIESGQWSLGLLLAVNCQEELPAAGSSRPAADIAASERLDGFTRLAVQRSICAAWRLPALPPAAADYVQSDIPSLVLAGSYDPVTPPAWSRATADHLSHSTYVEFAGQGHNVTIDNPCAERMQAAFLDKPLEPLETSCVSEAAGPDFVLPEDVYVAPGLANSVYDVELGSPRGTAWIETMAVIGLLGLVAMLIVLGVVGLAWLVRRERPRQLDKSAAIAYLLALLAIGAALTMPVLVQRINNEYLELNMMLYSLGPSRDFGPATLLAWIMPLAGLIIVSLAAITLWAWLTRRWRRGFRMLTALVVLASLPMVLLGLRWGLFTMLV